MDSEFNKRFLKRLLQLSGQINDRIGRKIMFMEVCGTHTTVISKSGLRGILADYMELRSGPGCPVCVTDQADIDTIIALSPNLPWNRSVRGAPAWRHSIPRERP